MACHYVVNIIQFYELYTNRICDASHNVTMLTPVSAASVCVAHASKIKKKKSEPFHSDSFNVYHFARYSEYVSE